MRRSVLLALLVVPLWPLTTGCGGGSSLADAASSLPDLMTSDLTSFDLAASPDLTRFPCSPQASCMATHDCIGLVNNSNQALAGLRMSSLKFTKPVAFSTGVVGGTIASAVALNYSPCNLEGSGTFNWLLQFDESAGTLKVGGARPIVDPTMGWRFADEMLTVGTATFAVKPVVFQTKPDSAGRFDVVTGAAALIPFFLDANGTSVVILPIRQLRLRQSTISASRNCIGSYNAAGLDPGNICLPDSTTPAFLHGGSLDGHITLEDADTVVVSVLQQSLCVLVSGDAATYGVKVGSTTVCKRDSSTGKIVFPGDWCAGTNTAGGCADSVALAADYAASSARIVNN